MVTAMEIGGAMSEMVSRVVRCGGMDIVLSVHTSRPPAPREWDEYVLSTKRSIDAFGHEPMRAIAITDGGAPDARQRGQLNDVLQGRTIPASILSDSVFVRGVVTALNWFNPGIKV